MGRPNLLFLMTHRGVSSVSCGPLDENEFDLQVGGYLFVC